MGSIQILAAVEQARVLLLSTGPFPPSARAAYPRPTETDVGTEEPKAEQHGQDAEAVQHIAEAHRILNVLRDRAEKHPAPREAIAEAIQKLEMALAILSVKTGGLL